MRRAVFQGELVPGVKPRPNPLAHHANEQGPLQGITTRQPHHRAVTRQREQAGVGNIEGPVEEPSLIPADNHAGTGLIAAGTGGVFSGHNEADQLWESGALRPGGAAAGRSFSREGNVATYRNTSVVPTVRTATVPARASPCQSPENHS